MNESPILCSGCGREIPADSTGQIPALCAHCGAMRIIDDVEEPAAEASAPNEAELEERRIRQIVRSRRAAVRMRGWYIVGMLACVILAAQQLGWFVTAVVRDARGAQQVARIPLALVLLAGAVSLRKRVRRLTAELRRHGLSEPTTPPDFTSLSDGSQQVRNLEKLK